MADVREAHSTERIKLGEPLPDTEYATLELLIAAYRDHAAGRGYGLVLERSVKNKGGKETIYMCDRGGKYRDTKNPDLNPTKSRSTLEAARSRKTNCHFKLQVPWLIQLNAFNPHALELILLSRNPTSTPAAPVLVVIDLEEEVQRTIMTRSRTSGATTTKIALSRGAGGDKDLYEAGILRERAFMRSIAPGKLGTHVDVKMLDDEEDTDEDEILNEMGKCSWEMFEKKKKK